MPGKPLGAFLEFIRVTFAGRVSADTTDADLLDRFTGQREEAAFTAILQRHGPLVLSVCRRVLGNAADVDDAFQATFLVLVRRAACIRKSGSVASWLYGVAYRVSLEAKTRAARRRVHEQHAGGKGHAEPCGDLAARELRSVLDEELEQLPQKYRAPLVLHYLAGKTKEETAHELGWSEGTVSGRLARARDLMRNRLTRRGLVLSSGALSAALAAEAAVASVSPSLAGAASTLASLFTAGDVAATASSARILALTEGFAKTMFPTKLKLAAAALLVFAAVAVGGGLLLQTPQKPSLDPLQKIAASEPAAASEKKPGVIVKVPGSGTLGVALSPDGKILARAGTGQTTGQTVDLWDVASGKKLHTLKGHTARILKVAFSPDGKTLASSGEPFWGEGSDEMKLWDVATGKERAPLGGLRKNIIFGAFSPDGKTLATFHMPIKEADPHVVKLWDLATGKEKMELGVGAKSFFETLAFSPDGKTLAISVGGYWKKPGSVQLWDLTTGKKRATMPGNDSWDWSVGFTPDGKTLVSAGFRTNEGLEGHELGGHVSQLTLWDVATAKERATILISERLAQQSFPLVFTADGKTLITTAWIFEKDSRHDASRIRLCVQHWDLATGKARATFWTPVNPGGNGGYLGFPFAALSADGKTVAWGGADGDKDNYVSADGKFHGRGTTAHVWEVESLATTPPDPFVPPADDAEAKAVEAITKAGGEVTLDDKRPGRPVIGLNLSGRFTPAQARDVGLKELKDLKQLTWLDLGDTKVTDEGLKELKDLKQLTTLLLTGTKVTDAGVKELQAALPRCKIHR